MGSTTSTPSGQTDTTNGRRVLWMDRRINRQVLRIDKKVVRAGKRVLQVQRVSGKYYEWPDELFKYCDNKTGYAIIITLC